MSDDAFRVLGLEPNADAKTVEATYWKRARELATQRTTDASAGAELELLNNAYQFLSKDFVYGTRNMKPKAAPRKGRMRRYVTIAAVATAISAGLIGGLGYRAEITDGAKDGYEQGEESWNDTIEWLQELDGTPTPGPDQPKGQ